MIYVESPGNGSCCSNKTEAKISSAFSTKKQAAFSLPVFCLRLFVPKTSAFCFGFLVGISTFRLNTDSLRVTVFVLIKRTVPCAAVNFQRSIRKNVRGGVLRAAGCILKRGATCLVRNAGVWSAHFNIRPAAQIVLVVSAVHNTASKGCHGRHLLYKSSLLLCAC